MSVLSRQLSFLLVAITLASASSPTLGQSVSAPTTQHADAIRLLDYWLEAQAAFDRVPALSAGVVVGQDLVWSRGYGFVDDGRTLPANESTIYSICSISKLFTSIATMQLWESEKVSLDADISRVVPSLQIPRVVQDGGRITLRGLLSHSSGLPQETMAPSWPPRTFSGPTRAEILEQTANQAPFVRPADHLQYSNLAMILLGEVVTSVSGEAYETVISQRILSPLKMVDTRPTIPGELLGLRLPRGHSALRRDGTRDKLPVFEPRGLLPAAGYSSTVSDLARFAAWQFRLLRSGGSEVLQASTLREMQRVQWSDPDGKSTWGLGFAVSREGQNSVVSHGGRCPGYETAIALALKDEVGVIALAAAQNAGPYTRQMRQLLLKGLRLPVAPNEAGSPDLTAYAGRYTSQPWISERVVVPWGKDLALLNLPSSNPAEELQLLRHHSGDTFRRVRDDGSIANEVVFSRDGSGVVAGYREWNYAHQKLDR